MFLVNLSIAVFFTKLSEDRLEVSFTNNTVW